MIVELDGDVRLVKGRTYQLRVGERLLPVRLSTAPLEEALDAVLIDRPERLRSLSRLDDYPYMSALLEENCLDYACERSLQVLESLRSGLYVFGAYKVGTRIARQALAGGIQVLGFLDNDESKAGTTIEGLTVHHPSTVSLEGTPVIVASGRHGIAIQTQLLKAQPGVVCINMHEFRYALSLPHCAEKNFGEFVHAPLDEAYRFISAFARLDDERSRKVFNGLIGMRTRLSITLAEDIRSPHDEEYFDPDFVRQQHVARYVDAGAFDGDTLRRLEQHFGPVEQAWLFEPELPAYYRALECFSDRGDVLIFNMGLDQEVSKSRYSPDLSFDAILESTSPLPTNITSYIQGVPLDSVVPAEATIGFFKLDIEGMEARALRGASSLIMRNKPVLAVCAYHRADDYWRLIDEVLSIRPDYRVAIRQYADFLADATLYFY